MLIFLVSERLAINALKTSDYGETVMVIWLWGCSVGAMRADYCLVKENDRLNRTVIVGECLDYDNINCLEWQI